MPLNIKSIKSGLLINKAYINIGIREEITTLLTQIKESSTFFLEDNELLLIVDNDLDNHMKKIDNFINQHGQKFNGYRYAVITKQGSTWSGTVQHRIDGDYLYSKDTSFSNIKRIKTENLKKAGNKLSVINIYNYKIDKDEIQKRLTPGTITFLSTVALIGIIAVLSRIFDFTLNKSIEEFLLMIFGLSLVEGVVTIVLSEVVVPSLSRSYSYNKGEKPAPKILPRAIIHIIFLASTFFLSQSFPEQYISKTLIFLYYLRVLVEIIYWEKRFKEVWSNRIVV